ncbi:MAG: HAD family hydrolase [Phycisphaerae bacterium]
MEAQAPTPTAGNVAAFFDVDGTLTATTIVDYYAYFRRRGMSPMLGRLWQLGFWARCLCFLLLDKIDRGRLNVVFYRSYAGLSVGRVRSLVADCYREVMRPRRFQEAEDCVVAHRRSGRPIVLVTGSIDFIVAPLARELSAEETLAPCLVEHHGRFTGDLNGPPIWAEEKARRIQAFADLHDIDLTRSYAYGDSIADLQMLEAVGRPHAVNPDRALARIARQRGWPTLRWKSLAGDGCGSRDGGCEAEACCEGAGR